MTEYLSRSQWTSASRGGALLTGDELHKLGFVDHYTGAPTTYGRQTVEQEVAAIRGIRDYHVNTNGWSDIGYQVVFTQAGRVWDARGISRVPAAHASSSNPRANWHGGAGLWLIGADEKPTDDIIEAARHFRHEVWLPRWSMATGRVGHQEVPGASTSCPGAPVMRLLDDGTLLLPPMGDDMPTADEIAEAVWNRVNPTSEIIYGSMIRYMHNAVRPDRQQTEGAVLGFRRDLARIEELAEAAVAAHSGGGHTDILARVDAHHAERMAALDAMDATLDGLPQAVAEELGDRDGQAVQEAVARALARVRVTVDEQ